MIRVILAGEGKNELGSFDTGTVPGAIGQPGVLETLLRQVRREGWQVVHVIQWRRLPKLQVGIGGRGDELNVHRAHHHARRRGCEILAFTRDRDGEKFADRDIGIERALDDLKNASNGPVVVGGVAVEKLESWLAAIAGRHRSESMRRPEEALAKVGVGAKDTRAMVALIEDRGIASIPKDARSLHRWLSRATEAFQSDAR